MAELVIAGFKALPLTVYLPRFGNFRWTLIAAPSWPADTAVAFRFSTTPEGISPMLWPATVLGAEATWNVPENDVQAVITADALFARLHVADPTGQTEWMIGRVEIQ